MLRFELIKFKILIKNKNNFRKKQLFTEDQVLVVLFKKHKKYKFNKKAKCKVTEFLFKRILFLIKLMYQSLILLVRSYKIFKKLYFNNIQ